MRISRFNTIIPSQNIRISLRRRRRRKNREFRKPLQIRRFSFEQGTPIPNFKTIGAHVRPKSRFKQTHDKNSNGRDQSFIYAFLKTKALGKIKFAPLIKMFFPSKVLG